MNARPRSEFPGEPLADFPLHGAPAGEPGKTVPEPDGLAAAALAPRVRALAADAAAILLAVAACLLAAVAFRGRGPRPEGLLWAAGFGVVLSFVATVLPLVLFGRTIGMALAGLAARGSGDTRNLAPGEAARRWIGTAVTTAGLGLPLLWTARHAACPTLADRLSGRALVAEDAGLP